MKTEAVIRSVVRVTGAIWITSLEDCQKAVTLRLLENLQAISDRQQQRARFTGFTPILQFDTYRNPDRGLISVGFGECIPCEELNKLRKGISLDQVDHLFKRMFAFVPVIIKETARGE